MAEKKPLKISYCTTCKGRLHHLKQTLPANMAAEKGNPNVEFVVLDYGSEDGLGEWIKQNYQAEIDSGRLRYARYEAPHFKMAHAKNMAHRLATGDVLCNVDADNFIAKDFSKWLGEKFTARPDSVQTILPTSYPIVIKRKALSLLRPLPDTSGVGGLVAISSKHINALGGYNELFRGWGGEDNDLVLRARALGMKINEIPSSWHSKAIAHSNELRVGEMSEEDRLVAIKNLAPTTKKFQNLAALRVSREPRANTDGNVGCGTVHINFSSEPTVIEPIGKSMPPAPEVEAGLNPHARVGHVASLARQHGGVYLSR